MTFMSSTSKYALVSLAADSSSNNPQQQAKHWQVAGKCAPLPIKKKTYLGDQVNE